jgi:dipeptidase E
MKLLLLSSGRAGGVYLTYAADWITEHFQASPGNRKTILFVGYAVKDRDAYAQRVAAAIGPLGIDVVSAHSSQDPIALLDLADGVFVGGGNSFRLLDSLQKTGMLFAIRDKAERGIPYLGWSAGINVVGPTIKTTNDMPILWPQKGLAGMGLLPFQLNPHYIEGKFYHEVGGKMVVHHGETRDERLLEFHEENETPVLGLREGSALRVLGSKVELLGGQPARVFEKGKPAVDVTELDFVAAALRSWQTSTMRDFENNGSLFSAGCGIVGGGPE